MTLAAMAKQAEYLPTLLGAECSRAFTSYAGTLNLYFGALAPPDSRGFREPERSLICEAWWRLETSAIVLVGSSDTDATIEERVQVLVGKRVQETEIFLPSYMARIAFALDLTVWLFPDDARWYGKAQPNPQDWWEYPRAPWWVEGPGLPEAWE